MTDNLPVKSNVIEGEVVETFTYFDSNNSGGSFWLTDADFLKLQNAGWVVDWGDRVYPSESNAPLPRCQTTTYNPDVRWLGAAAMTARRYDLTFREAIEEWQRITGEDAGAQGCNCCGPPFDFEEREVLTNRRVRDMSHDVVESWSI